jgi:hypothetical protein
MKRITLLILVCAMPVLGAEQGVATDTQAPAVPPTTAAPAATPPIAAPEPLQPATAAKAKNPTKGRAQDRLELDTTQITGNQELPKVMYVVPWKRSDLGDLTGRPANSLLDEVLAPVDRDVFRRQNRYYEALRPDTGSPGSGASQP